MNRLSVIIPTYNRSYLLRLVLTALERQPREHLDQVLVCDDGSSDDTAAVAAEFRQRLPLTYLFQEDLGFRAGAARNLGMARAQTDVLLFLDDDCIVLPGCLERHLQLHATRPRAVGIGRIGRIPADTALSLDALPDPREMEPDERTPLHIDSLDNHGAPWGLLWTCHCSVNMAGMSARFDERLQGWGVEDTDLGLQLHRQGAQFCYLADAIIVHQNEARPRSPLLQERLGMRPDYSTFMRNAALLLEKYAHDPQVAQHMGMLLSAGAPRPNDGEWITQLV
jgi:glycosyltransferase involved in cell wall biosynthesis